jgi:outer membrane lipoprotein-sorting protein
MKDAFESQLEVRGAMTAQKRFSQLAQALTCAILVSNALIAQALPNANELLKRLEAALKQHTTMRYEEEETYETTFQAPVRIHHSEAVRLPDKWREESTREGGSLFLKISDGETTWSYSQRSNQYWKEKTVHLPWADALTFWGLRNMSAKGFTLASQKILRSETMELEGHNRDCWVVETEMTLPSPLPELVSTAWLDKETGIALQSVDASGGNGKSTTRTAHLELDVPLPDSLFVFTPPPGAKQTK